jgi:chemotaxis signal transduction protein
MSLLKSIVDEYMRRVPGLRSFVRGVLGLRGGEGVLF